MNQLSLHENIVIQLDFTDTDSLCGSSDSHSQHMLTDHTTYFNIMKL